MKLKTLFTFIYILLYCNHQSAQVSINEQMIPSLGDTLFKSYSYERINPVLLEKKKSNLWNYAFVRVPFVVMERYFTTARGKHKKMFPKANMVLLKANENEEYYHKSKSEFLLIGKRISSSITEQGFFLLDYGDGLPIVPNIHSTSRRPNYFDHKIIIKTARSELHESIKKMIPDFADSLSWEIHKKVDCDLEERGLMMFNFENMPVIMLEKHISTTFRFRIKSSGGSGWIGYHLDFDKWPECIKDIYVAENYTRREFFSQNYKSVMMSYNIISGKAISHFFFQTRNAESDIIFYAHDKKDVLVYPNPSFGEFNFRFMNFPQGDYYIEIFNVVGKTITKNRISKINDSSVHLDLSWLRKGTYIYSILDANGKKLATKRLGIISH
jgi:hypothetical protein